ncbi:MAPEG family protein [Novosphingobium pokkalii]|uniref:MAPEG family protein n=1 Tax=Novosphingobium pokkalii TaxID=1770194 RepID=UPI003640908F
MPIVLPITLAAAGAAAILNIWLMVRVGMVRREAQISLGDGGHPALIARMRAHANFIESAPIVLVLSGAVELARPGSPFLLGAVAIYLLGRVGHGVGMDGGKLGRLRMVGTFTTLLTLLGLAIWAISIAADA